MRGVAVLIALFACGCASDGTVADVQRSNLALLEKMELALTLTPDEQRTYEGLAAANVPERDFDGFLREAREKRAERYRKLLGDASGAQSLAARAAVVAREDVEARRLPSGPRKLLLDWRMSEIQADYERDLDRLRVRSEAIAKLYLGLVESIRALRANGRDILAFLELGPSQRLFSHVDGMTPAQLDQIRDELDALARDLGPGAGR